MDRAIDIIKSLSTQSYTTSKALAEQLNVSSRTIRNDVRLLNQELKKNGAYIESKARHGMLLHITDEETYHIYYQNLINSSPIDKDNRITQIIEYLLTMEDSITMDDLCDIFYVSRSTLKKDMKEIREIFEKYQITIDHRANQGLKIIGKEQDLRNCLTNLQKSRLEEISLKDENLEKIISIISAQVNKHHFEISDYSMRNFALHISVAITRIKDGKELQLDADMEQALGASPDIDLLLSIVNEIEKTFHVHFTKGEIGYLLLQISGKKTITTKNISGNTVISEETYKLVTQMLERVNAVFKIDFRYDLELITMLATHLMPLEIRAKHGIAVHNSMADDIRHNVILSYNMAIIACDTLEQKIGVKLPMDEIAFVALPFSLALKRKWKNQKEKVLIVCGSGKASSELLAYQVKENFGNYLDVVGATNRHSLELYDFSNVDYILTTVPIDIPVPIPIIRTSTFFETNSIDQVNQAITDTRSSRFIEYFHKNMVFWSSSDDKNEILKHMCENAVQNYNIPDDFFHYVMKREDIGRTSFGNLITIAHPIHPIGQESFVGLTILNHPIDWDGEPAQLIFLLSMKESGENKMKDFYKAMTKLVNNKHYIELLTKTKNYVEVINILKLVASSDLHTVL